MGRNAPRAEFHARPKRSTTQQHVLDNLPERSWFEAWTKAASLMYRTIDRTEDDGVVEGIVDS